MCDPLTQPQSIDHRLVAFLPAALNYDCCRRNEQYGIPVNLHEKAVLFAVIFIWSGNQIDHRTNKYPVHQFDPVKKMHNRPLNAYTRDQKKNVWRAGADRLNIFLQFQFNFLLIS